MEKNISKIDSTIRLILGLIALYLAYVYNAWWLVLAILLIWTSVSMRCPLYNLFKKKEKPKQKPVAKKKKK